VFGDDSENDGTHTGADRAEERAKRQPLVDAWQDFLIERAMQAKADYQRKDAAAGTLGELREALAVAPMPEQRSLLRQQFAERTIEAGEAYQLYEAEWVEALRTHHHVEAHWQGHPNS
jgi:hypothetical protein